MAKLNAPAAAGFNAGKSFYARPFRVADIKIDPKISKIFRIQDKVYEEISANIKRYGYDKSQPVVVWKGKNILVDGHTRLAAAKELGLEEIPAVEKEFEDMDEATLYTFERQVTRRNLTPSEILTAAQMIHGRKEHDGKGRAAEQLAARLGVSAATVYQARKILAEAPKEDVKAIRAGEKSIKAVYNKIKTTAPVRDERPGEGFSISATVILLAEAGEIKAAKLVISHFVRKAGREEFYQSLPEGIRGKFSVETVALLEEQ